jgi:hypothetical protein
MGRQDLSRDLTILQGPGRLSWAPGFWFLEDPAMADDERMRWRIENWHRRGVLAGYRLVRGSRTERQFDRTYVAADPAATGALDRAYAMAEARRALLDLDSVEPEQQTVAVE